MLAAQPNLLNRCLRILIDLLLLLNLLILLALPWLLSAVYDHPRLLGQLEAPVEWVNPDAASGPEYPSDLPRSSYPFYLAFLYVCGASTAWLLTEGHRILRRIEHGQPFTADQASAFRRVAGAFAALAVAFAVKILFYNTLLTMFCCALFWLLILIALVLSQVFRQAFEVKSENDLTV